MLISTESTAELKQEDPEYELTGFHIEDLDGEDPLSGEVGRSGKRTHLGYVVYKQETTDPLGEDHPGQAVSGLVHEWVRRCINKQ